MDSEHTRQRVGGRYPLIELLGVGGMSEVWLSEQPALRREVAVKLVRPSQDADPDARARFVREGRSVASLRHPSIVTVHDLGFERDGRAYLVMERVEGRNLSAVFADRRAGMLELADLVIEVLEALDTAHAAGIVHRDLKPDNVMVLDDPQGRHRVKVLDFGIAKAVFGDDTQITREGLICGTPHYTAPEQALAEEVDGRTDIYAAGVMLYEALVGRRPFDGLAPISVLAAHVTGEVPPIPMGMPRPLLPVVRRAMARRPADRYRTASDMARDLWAAIRLCDVSCAETVGMAAI